MNHGNHGRGIVIERRTLLWMPFALAGGALLRGTPLQAAEPQEAAEKAAALTPITRDELGRRWQALANELQLLPKEFDEAYAAALAGLIARLPITALPTLDSPRVRGGVRGGPSWFLQPCLTVEFQIEPGAEIRLHNHPPQVVVTLCATGEASFRHFELHGETPPCTTIDGKEFELRETRSGLLLPGRTTALTRARDGIHGFVAGDDGARIVDFTFSLTHDVETFSYVELSDEPIDAERRLFGAVWSGKGP